MNLEVPQNLIGVDLELSFESAEKERGLAKMRVCRLSAIFII